MPVEIKELIIRANIVNGNDNNSQSQISGSSEQKQEREEAIVATCVAQVLKILERKQER